VVSSLVLLAVPILTTVFLQ